MQGMTCSPNVLRVENAQWWTVDSGMFAHLHICTLAIAHTRCLNFYEISPALFKCCRVHPCAFVTHCRVNGPKTQGTHAPAVPRRVYPDQVDSLIAKVIHSSAARCCHSASALLNSCRPILLLLLLISLSVCLSPAHHSFPPTTSLAHPQHPRSMPPTSPDPAKIDFQKYCFYGTVLNVPPILLMYPMRTVRLLQQRKSSVPVSSSIFTVIKDVQQKNGFRALYAGATVFSIGLTNTKILQFATYDYLGQKTKEKDYFGVEVLKNPSVLSGLLGTFSAVVTTFFVVPFDVVSQQITLAKAGAQGNIVPSPVPTTAASVAPPLVPETVTVAGSTAVASKIPMYAQGSYERLPAQQMPISESLRLQFKQEGVRFLFRGYIASLMSTIPFFAAYFPAYEISRVWVKDGIELVRSMQPNSDAPFPPPELNQLIVSSIAGSMASLSGVMISSPSDMVKTRIQTEQRLQPANGTGVKLPLPSLKWMDVFMEIWKKEGFMKFFSGTKARAILAVPGGALNFVIFDFVRSASITKEPSMSLSQIQVSAAQEALY